MLDLERRGGVHWLPDAAMAPPSARTAPLQALMNESRRLGEFIEWQFRAEECGLRREILPLVVLRRRIHDGNTTARLASERLEYLRVLRSALLRRRAGGPR